MTREEKQREYWEGRIPKEWDIIRLRDAHRAINRGQVREIFGKRWLERKAAAGYMGAIGGPGTELGHYRVRRADLIEFLVHLDVVLAPPDNGCLEAVAPAEAVLGDRPRRRKRRGSEKERDRAARETVRKPTPPMPAQQTSLFDLERED